MYKILFPNGKVKLSLGQFIGEIKKSFKTFFMVNNTDDLSTDTKQYQMSDG